ncbi:uncharacterized protein LOC144904279 [Branchiostoma floridae x Branchiostoma belcheri]
MQVDLAMFRNEIPVGQARVNRGFTELAVLEARMDALPGNLGDAAKDVQDRALEADRIAQGVIDEVDGLEPDVKALEDQVGGAGSTSGDTNADIRAAERDCKYPFFQFEAAAFNYM